MRSRLRAADLPIMHPEMDHRDTTDRFLLDEATLETMLPFCAGLAGLWGLYSVGHFFLLPLENAVILGPVAFVSSIVLGSLAVALSRGAIAARNADAAGLALASVALVNVMGPLAATGRPLDSLNVIIFILAAGCVFLRRRLVIATGSLAALLGAWFLALHGSFAVVAQYSVAAAVSVFMATIFCTVRRRTLLMLGQQKVLEEQRRRSLQDSLARERAILEAALDCIVLIDHSGRIVEFNPAAEATFGYRREDVLGKALGETIIPAGMREAHFAGLRNYLSTGKAAVLGKRIEIEALRADGSEFPVELAIVHVADVDPPVFTGYMRDITERAAARSAIEAARDAAVESSQLKSEFLATLSHEIRTPLNAIIGMVELTLDSQLSTQQREYLGIVSSNSEALLQLLNNVLDFSKIEAEQLELDQVSFNPAEVVERVVASLAPRAAADSLVLACERREPLPETVVGDPNRIRQVVTNLVGNALKFTPEGQIDVTIAATEPTVGSIARFTIEVRDTGIGIAPDEQARVFDKFFQAHSREGELTGGTGLGLSISKSLVEAMGGTLTLESSPGEGSTFRVLLPLPVGVAPHHSTSAGDRSTPALETPRNLPPGTRVLVVEDNADSRLYVQRILTRAGGDVDVAADGRIAVSKVRDTTYDAIVMDIDMPKMDGMSAARSIRALEQASGRPRVPIVALTAHALKGTREECLAAGMNAYLTKPLESAGKLINTLEGCLQQLRTVLVVDDVAVNRTVIERYLDSEPGVTVLVADNGSRALELLAQHPVDLVLLDVEMPGLNGFETLPQIERRDDGTPRVVMMTGHDDRDTRDRGREAGCDGFLTKPVRREALLHELRCAPVGASKSR